MNDHDETLEHHVLLDAIIIFGLCCAFSMTAWVAAQLFGNMIIF
jgi:hypothetical protein